jgi:hypothetical protein
MPIAINTNGVDTTTCLAKEKTETTPHIQNIPAAVAVQYFPKVGGDYLPVYTGGILPDLTGVEIAIICLVSLFHTTYPF